MGGNGARMEVVTTNTQLWLENLKGTEQLGGKGVSHPADKITY
jgi:hypothetical protein